MANRLEMGPVTRLQLFSIRDGAISQATSLLVKPTIPRSFHWLPIAKMDPMRAVEHMGVFIQMYHAHLAENPIATVTPEVLRKITIILGVARAVCTGLYEVDTRDLIVDEAVAPWLQYEVDDAGNSSVGLMAEVPTARLQAMNSWAPLSEQELSVVAVLHMSAIGILPLQGYSLAMCNHHYLSDPTSQSRKAYDVVEKAFWQSTSIATWFSQDADKIRDTLWHKVGHPVSLTLKRKLAFDPKVPKMLVEAGAGPAASRLPAVETEMRAAKSYRTLLQTVRPLIEGFGGNVEFDSLELAMKTVQAFPAENPTLVVTDVVRPGVPDNVTSRSHALAWLGEILEKNKDMTAVAYGFYVSLSEQNSMLSGGASVDTLKTSYSLRKLRTQNLASFIAGQQAHGDYASHKARERAEGRYLAPDSHFSK